MTTLDVIPSQVERSTVFEGRLWAGVRRVLERAAGIDELRAHRLQLLEAQRRRELGLELPADLAEEAASAVRSTLLTRAFLTRIRDVCEGDVLVLKGPEVAAAYPSPWLRPYIDVDILVRDVHDAERRLRAAGFVGVGAEMDWGALHHVQRLAAPDSPASVEVHRRPKWVADGAPPTMDELLDEAVPSATGVEGLLAPSPRFHAVLLAVHAWTERPLGRLGDLVDVAATIETGGHGADVVAARYGTGRIWRATQRALDALLVADRPTWPTRTWARHLPEVRERTVLEMHLTRALEPFASLPPWRAPAGMARMLRRTVLPHDDEGWNEKLARAGRAIRSPRARAPGYHESGGRSRTEDE
jgi:hypothetical protein